MAPRKISERNMQRNRIQRNGIEFGLSGFRTFASRTILNDLSQKSEGFWSQFRRISRDSLFNYTVKTYRELLEGSEKNPQTEYTAKSYRVWFNGFSDFCWKRHSERLLTKSVEFWITVLEDFSGPAFQLYSKNAQRTSRGLREKSPPGIYSEIV